MEEESVAVKKGLALVRQNAVGGAVAEPFSKKLPFGPIFIGEDKFIFCLCHLAYSIQNFSPMFARARVAEASDGNWWREDK